MNAGVFISVEMVGHACFSVFQCVNVYVCNCVLHGCICVCVFEFVVVNVSVCMHVNMVVCCCVSCLHATID